MFRPSTLLLALALALPAAATVPRPALQDRAGRAAPRGQDDRAKAKGLFGGAQVQLAPRTLRKSVDPKAVMRKVKELQVKTKARARQRRERVIELADADQLSAWFTTCDHNANGWVSFSEAAYSLRFTRGRFQIFDADTDGRLVADEFKDFYLKSVLASGRFTTPRAKASSGPPPQRTPQQIRAAYDTDLDAALGELELAQLLQDYEQAAADPAALLDALDRDGDRRLTLDELAGLHEILYPPGAGPLETEPDPAGPQTVVDLFGKVVPRLSQTGAPPGPPRIEGPVSHFHRLDIDRDGYISVADLETLLRPVRLGVRPHAVINTLDTDGDMRLSEAEFLGTLIELDR